MSCLFDSIGYFINLDSYYIRNIICDYLEKNLPLIDGIETHTLLKTENGNVNRYITNMRKKTQFGGGIELRAAAEIWKIQIIVEMNQKNHLSFKPLSGTYNHTIKLKYHNEHYEPI